jgi:hypothetical protein
MGQSGVAFDDVLELTAANFLGELLPGQAVEVVEAVAIHEGFDLRNEDQVEGLPQ